jgi:hypothetical protein
MVNFTGDREMIQPGDWVTVVVEEVFGHAFKGRAVSRVREGTRVDFKADVPAAIE